MPLAEFHRSFSGIAISIKSGKDFETGGRSARPIVQLLRLALVYRVQLVFVLLIGALIAIPGFIVPNFMGIFVDDVVMGWQKDWLSPLVVALIVAILIQKQAGRQFTERFQMVVR